MVSTRAQTGATPVKKYRSDGSVVEGNGSPRLRKAKSSTPNKAENAKSDNYEAEHTDHDAWQWVESNPYLKEIGAFLIVLGTPLPLFLCLFSCVDDGYKCSVTDLAMDLTYRNPGPTFWSMWNACIRMPSMLSWGIVIGWDIFRLVLHVIVPGTTAYGEMTPAGQKHKYKINGGWTTIVSIILIYVAGIHLEWFSLMVFWNNLLEIMFASFVWSIAGCQLLWIRGTYFPSDKDHTSTGWFWSDFNAGVELNPRILGIDIKIWNNVHVGMGVWMVVNLLYAYAQVQIHGFLSNSMVLVLIGQGFYVFDLFVKEVWYLATLDIMLDAVGYYLYYGCHCWLPFMYTLQALFLVVHPIQLTNLQFWGLLSVSIGFYILFRWSNNQRHSFRACKGKNLIFGKKPTWINAAYTTLDGSKRTNMLLTSGFWGWARHFNYLCDFVQLMAWSMPAAFATAEIGVYFFIPFFYPVFILILFINRIGRDETRLSAKYGKAWDDYCTAVPYKFIPYVY